ncbi:hypothetical protein [Campylobacter concisus]|nr:hypothetical protein [Campylobacter concisus]
MRTLSVTVFVTCVCGVIPVSTIVDFTSKLLSEISAEIGTRVSSVVS